MSVGVISNFDNWGDASAISLRAGSLNATRLSAPPECDAHLLDPLCEGPCKAKRYCAQPFEIRHEGARKVEVPIKGEWIGAFRNGQHPLDRPEIQLLCHDVELLAEADLQATQGDIRCISCVHLARLAPNDLSGLKNRPVHEF